MTSYVYTNINTYAVYYAKHTPHLETIDPEVIAVVEHLEWIEKPELEGVEYGFKGRGWVSFYNKSEDVYSSFSAGDSVMGYRYSDTNNFSYYFDFNTMVLYLIMRDSDELLNVEDFNEEQLKQEIHELLQPIIDAQPEPHTNLQCLFDKVYYERYN